MRARPDPKDYPQSFPMRVQIFTKAEALKMNWIVTTFLSSTLEGHDGEPLTGKKFDYIALIHFEGTSVFSYMLISLPKAYHLVSGRHSGVPSVITALHEKAAQMMDRDLTVDQMSPDGMTQRWI